MDTYTDPLAQKRGKGGIAHIRTDSNSWCLCLVNDATRRNHQAWFSLSTLGGTNPSLGCPQTRRWAISGLLSVSTPLDHFSSPLSPRSFSVLFFNHPSLVPVSVYLTLSQRWKPDASTFLEVENFIAVRRAPGILLILEFDRSHDSLDSLWHHRYRAFSQLPRGCTNLMSL